MYILYLYIYIFTWNWNFTIQVPSLEDWKKGLSCLSFQEIGAGFDRENPETERYS
jgi:hypothetical protein